MTRKSNSKKSDDTVIIVQVDDLIKLACSNIQAIEKSTQLLTKLLQDIKIYDLEVYTVLHSKSFKKYVYSELCNYAYNEVCKEIQKFIPLTVHERNKFNDYLYTQMIFWRVLAAI